MTLPALPDVDTILANSAAVLRDVVLPELHDEWPRSCTRIIVEALHYASELLHDNRPARHREELAAVLDELCPGLGPEAAARAGDGSAYERASGLLVWAREDGGADAERVIAALHPILSAQLDEEVAAAAPLLSALHVAMRGDDR